MPEFRLDDSTIIELPNDATPAEIDAIVSAHYGVPVRAETP